MSDESQTPKSDATQPVVPAEAGANPPIPPVDPPAAAPAAPEGEDNWKERFDGVNRTNAELSANYQKTIDVNVKLVEKNPDLINDIAEADPELANKVAEKIHGVNYAEWKEQERLSDIKAQDPDKYNTEVRLIELEKEKAERVKAEEKAFFDSKGIKANPMDSKYSLLQEKLGLLNPAFVNANRVEALKMVYEMNFPSAPVDPIAAAQAAAAESATSGSGGSAPATAPLAGSPKTLSPGQQAFRDLVMG